VVETVEKLRIVIRPDRPGPRTVRSRAQEAPGPVGQTRQDDDEEYELQHKNLLPVNIRAVGRLGPVTGTEGRGEATGGFGSADRREATGEQTARPGSRMVVDVLVYTIARILLVGVLGVVIYVGGQVLGIQQFPVVVPALFAIVIAFPLGIWLFAPLRRRATASIAVFDERRRRDRQQLRARLSGDRPPAE
jgi:uncharacterized protein DUF4229